jgi:hypothetical protein
MLIVVTKKGMRALLEISRVDLVHLDRDPTGLMGANLEDSGGVLKAWIYHFRSGGEKVILPKRIFGLRTPAGRN